MPGTVVEPHTVDDDGHVYYVIQAEGEKRRCEHAAARVRAADAAPLFEQGDKVEFRGADDEWLAGEVTARYDSGDGLYDVASESETKQRVPVASCAGASTPKTRLRRSAAARHGSPNGQARATTTCARGLRSSHRWSARN